MANTKLQGRLWGKVLYPEDYENWETIEEHLRDTHIEIMISPEHTPDENETKIHRHILLFFEANQTIDSVNRIISDATGKESKYALKENSERGSIRYLIHADHPHKQQFRKPTGELDIDSIKCLNDCTDRRDAAFTEGKGAWDANFLMIQDIIDDYQVENIIELRSKLMELGLHSLCRDLHEYNVYFLNTLMTGYYQMHRRVENNLLASNKKSSKIKDRKEMLQ